MIATGIVFVGDRIIRYVHGDASTFTNQVEPGESLLITSKDIYADGLPDPAKAKDVLDTALAKPVRSILW